MKDFELSQDKPAFVLTIREATGMIFIVSLAFWCGIIFKTQIEHETALQKLDKLPQQMVILQTNQIEILRELHALENKDKQ